jgi:phospholipid transport system transporter-binding protein
MQGLKKQSGSEIVLNASGLLRFDSAALAVLLEFKRQCLASSKRFSIHGLPKQLGDLATLYGIAELLPLATAPVSSPVK